MRLNAETRPRFSTIAFFLKRHKSLYAGILVLTVVGSVAESISVAAFFPMFSTLLSDPQGETSGVLGFLTSWVDVVPVSSPIAAASILVIGLFLVKTVFTLVRETVVAFASAKVVYGTKKEILEKYSGAQYQFFLDSQQGSLIYNVITAPDSVGLIMLNGPKMLAFFLKIVFITAMLILIFPLAAAAFIVLGLAYYGVIYVLSRKVSFNIGKGKANASAEMTIQANEYLSGIRQIIAYGLHKPWTDKFNGANRTFSQLQARDMAWLAAPRPIMEFSAISLLLGFLLILNFSRPDSIIEVLPRLGVFAIAMVQLLPALTSFGAMRMAILSALPNMQLAHQTITETVPQRIDGHLELDTFEESIKFENVRFAHKNRDALFENLNLRIEKGKITALVGPSGSGKTTIINLILRLFEPSDGKITVNGVPLNELTYDSWLSKIGFVSQDPFTFHASVKENILFGRHEGSDRSVLQSAKIANAEEFISEHPEGYDTVVGDRGMRISGGQQQRLAIARAVFDDPEILIFDEATSSLDSISERLVQEAIETASQGKTVILVAHRLSTVRRADKIIVLDNGKVVEEGSHDELLDRQGHYSRLVESQA